MGNTVFFTETIQRMLSRHADPGLQAVFLVVDPRVDHARVARAYPGADIALGFENNHLASPGCECAGHRQANNAGTDDDALNVIHLPVPAAARLQPRPTKGILVAMMVMNCTLASNDKLAM